MYSNNNIHHSNWKQTLALVIAGLLVWQMILAPAHADESSSSMSQLVGYVFSGDTQQGRVVNVDINLRGSDGALLATTTTNARGSYAFEIEMGSYIIENSVNGATRPVTVAAGVVMVGLDFYDTNISEISTGLQIGTPTTSQLIGYVFGEESQDVRLVNTEVALLHADGTPVLDSNGQPVVAITNGIGNYSFNVNAGTYILRNKLNGATRTVDVADNVVLVGMDFYEVSAVANIPLAVSLNNVGIDINMSWLGLVVAVVMLTVVTLPKASKHR